MLIISYLAMKILLKKIIATSDSLISFLSKLSSQINRYFIQLNLNTKTNIKFAIIDY